MIGDWVFFEQIVGGPYRFNRLPLTNIPVGPEHVVCRILLRTPQVRFWIHYDQLMVALASHGRKRK